MAGGMAGWFLGLAVCLGVLAAGAAYYGLLVAASTLVSIFVVLLTLYLFLRYWPEEDVIARRQAPPVSAPAQTPSR